MHDIYYVGSQNEKVDFRQLPYRIVGGSIFDGNYDAVEENNRIQEFERKVTDKTLSIDISAANQEELCSAIEQLENVVEKDIVNVTPGKLYVGKSYLKCWITGTSKSRWVNDLDGIGNELTIKSDYPYLD